jgi:hypothetical protein
MKVNFRITGMYFGRNKITDIGSKFKNTHVIVEVNDNPTVLDIMKACSIEAFHGKIDNVEFFSFSPTNPAKHETISSIYIKYKNAPKNNRPAGLYVLNDESTTNRTITFQYYIYDQNFKQLNNNNFTKSFNEKPENFCEIKDGYSVIIRQVVILTAPQLSDYVINKAKKSSDFLVNV